MDSNGYCEVCPDKCIWSEHFNQPYIIIYSTYQHKTKSDELYNKYTSSKSNLSKGE